MIFLILFTLFFQMLLSGIASIAGFAGANLHADVISRDLAQTSLPQSQVSLKDPQHSFQVEIARTDAELDKGLMYRTSMPANHGMLFVFKNDATRTFWMKNTLIPLDMIFADAKGNIITILSDVPPCELPENQSRNCPTYPSQKPSRYVLELNAGISQQLDLHEGDQLFLPTSLKEIL